MSSLEVVLNLPPAPLVLADSNFLATLSQVESDVAAVKVIDTASADAAAKLQARLTFCAGELDAFAMTALLVYCYGLLWMAARKGLL